MTVQRTIPSPCNRLCTLDPATQQCVGCHRTLDEICAWGDYTDVQRQAVLDRVAQRRDAARQRRERGASKN